MELLIFCGSFVIIALAARQIGTSLVPTGLPLISGFLFTGILCGPYVLDLVDDRAVASLAFVDEIALGFIAFSAGAELYIKEMRRLIRNIAWITAGLVVFTFSLSSICFYLLSNHIPFLAGQPGPVRAAAAILAGAILVARSPSSAIAIVNELRARGRFTQTVLGVTVIMDVVVILLFALNSSVADAMLTGLHLDFAFVLLLAAEITAALTAGVVVSRLILVLMAMPGPLTLKPISVLALGWGVFGFSGWVRHESAARFGVEVLLEPLLICMVAGFLAANVKRFRSELLNLLHRAGLPVYIAFFTLTGAALSLDVLARAWPFALALFFIRGFSIFLGTFTGGVLAGSPARFNRVAWMAYITQAGVGLGLAKQVAVEFPAWGAPFSTVIIAVIVINQLVGPPLFKRVLRMVKEDHARAEAGPVEAAQSAVVFGWDGMARALALSLASRGWQVSLARPGRPADLSGDPQDPLPDGIVEKRFSDLDAEGLEAVGCRNAWAVVAMMDDPDNYRICETAYEHFGTQTLVARLNDRDDFKRFEALGVLIVDPATAIVSLLDHFVRAPSSASLLMGLHQDRNVMDIRVKNPDLSGLALRDLRLPLDTLIMSVRRRGVLFIPHDFTRLEAGDRVTAVGPDDSLKQMALRFDTDGEEAVKQLVRQAAAPGFSPETPSDPAGSQTRKPLASDRFSRMVETAPLIDFPTAMTMDQCFRQAATIMAPSLDMDPEGLRHRLHEREAEATTVLAPGLAVPHIIVPGQKKFVMLMGRCAWGIVFDPLKPPVSILFVLAGTRDERRFHLQALSAIARMVMDPFFEKQWMRARSVDRLRKIILDTRQKHE